MSVFSDAIRLLGHGIKARSPIIMTGAAVTGVFVTAGLAVEATPGAMRDIEKAKEKKGSKLTKLEVVKVAGPHYIPAGISGLLTSTSMILSTKTCLKRNAELAACIMAGQSAMSDYQNKMIEVLGEEGEKKASNEITKKKIDQAEQDLIDNAPGSGKVLCFDNYTGRYFWSNIEEIRKGLNQFNKLLLGSILGESLNTFYSYTTPLGDIGYGEQIGFNPSYGLVELRFSTILSANGTPCLVMDFRNHSTPRLGYDVA